MNRSLIITVLLISMVAGCATIRQAATDISIEDAENMKVMREIAKQCLRDWPVISGFIKGVLCNRINELPNETVKALERLDEIAAQTEHSDYELGECLGLKAQVMCSVVQATLEKYAPNVIGYLPLVL